MGETKGSPFFSALRDFSEKCFFPKGSPLQFFLLFCDRMDVEKSQRVPPYSFFSALWDFFLIFFSPRVPLQFLWYFTTEWMLKNPKGSPLTVFFRHWDFFLIFFSPRVPLQFLWYFTTEWVFKNPEGSPFLFFGIVRLFFRQRVPLQLRQKCWQFQKCPPF